MTLWKRVKHLWMQLTTEEVFGEYGWRERQSMVRRPPRG